MEKLGLTESIKQVLDSRLLESETTNSVYKQKFINYCKGKVENLGTIVAKDEDDEDFNEELQIALIDNHYKQAKPAYILIPDPDYDERLIITDKDGNVFINSPMSNVTGEVQEMTFDKIDTEFYNNVLEYWDELYMDDALELDDVDKASREKIQNEFKCPEHFDYNVISRAGGADVEVYCKDIPDLKAMTTTMNENGEYVQDYFDIDGLWQVSEIDKNGKFVKNLYINGWQEMFKVLQDEYDNVLKNKNKVTEGIQDERLANSIKWLENSGYSEYKTGDKYTLLVNDTKYDGQVVGAMFYGKSAKPAWHYRFKDMDELDDYTTKYLERKAGQEEVKQQWKDKRKLTKDHDIKVGDIFYTMWGYDQTNIDFYEVVAVRGSRIDLRELHQQYVGHDGNYDSVVPATGENRFKDDEIHTVSARADGTVTSLSSFEYPTKWDGKPKDQTDAYSGH